MTRITLFAALFSMMTACGTEPSTSTSPRRLSAAAQASLTSATSPNECIASLKAQVYAGTLDISDYESRALTDCGIDFNAPPDSTKGSPSEPPVVTEPTPAEAAYAACANAVKAEVEAGTLAIENYEGTLASRCPH